MLSFYLIFGLIYVFFLVSLASSWRKNASKKPQHSFSPSVSILIPFRNERINLPSIFALLSTLNYPELEIIFIDDHSDDGSWEWLEQETSFFRHISVIKSQGQGKKSALEIGVQFASGELIFCTDADCSFSDNWIEEMIAPLSDPAIQLVAGAVISEENDLFFSRFQQLDWASILLITNYFFTHKKPLMCSGANLAYRKSAFLQVNGYQGNLEYTSGDDEFLLKKIVNEFGSESCKYIYSNSALVLTKSEKSWSSLFNQRVRWSSKWRAHDSISHILTAILSFVMQLGFLCSFGLLFFGTKGILLFVVFWGVKIGAEYHGLGKVLNSFNKRLPLTDFILTSFIHPLYVLRVGLGALGGKFTWKERVNHRSVNLESEK